MSRGNVTYQMERTDAEINELRKKIDAVRCEGTTKYAGMTYEEGLNEMLEWLTESGGGDDPMD